MGNRRNLGLSGIYRTGWTRRHYFYGEHKYMVKLIEFETEEDLIELTGLTEEELWEKGFNLDDWDIGFQSDTKLHKTPTEEDIENGFCIDDLLEDYSLPAHWLMMEMNHYYVGAHYVFLDGKHYYTVHHS